MNRHGIGVAGIIVVMLFGVVHASAELTPEEFTLQIYNAILNQDAERMVLLVWENPTTAVKVKAVFEGEGKGKDRNAEKARVLAEMISLALKVINRDVSKKPKNISPAEEEARELLKEAATLYDNGDIAGALEICNKIIALVPDHGSALWLRGTIYIKQKKNDLAVADYKKVVVLAPSFADAQGNLGWLLIELGRFEEARPHCEKAYSLDPKMCAWTINMGHIYLLTGDRARAREYYGKAFPLINSDEQFAKEVVADFQLFIKKGWKASECKEEMEWMQKRWEQLKKANSLSGTAMIRCRQGKSAEACWAEKK